jgi:hypothetical protein
LKTNTDNQPLLQVAGWALGEFQEDPSDTIDVMIRLTLLPQTSVETKLVLVTALAKLAARFGEQEKVAAHLTKFENNNNLEVQQRVGELIRVLSRTDVCDALLAPVEPEETHETPTAPAPRSASETALIELLAEPTKPIAQTEPSSVAFKPPPNAIEALRTADYVIYFELQRNPLNPTQIAVRATTVNLTSVALTQFIVQYKIPQGWAISLQEPSGNVLEAVGGGVIRQIFILANQGTVPLKMSVQISYLYRTQPITENGEINPIFG